MKKRMKKQVVMAVVAALVLWAVGAWAGEGMRCGKDDPARFEHAQKMDKIIDELGLSSVQKDEIKKQRADFAAKSKELREKIRSTRSELKNELDKPTADKARLDGLTGDLKTLVGQQIQNRVDSVIAMKQVLTPEQFGKMKNLVEKRKKGYGGQWKHRAPREKNF